MADGTPDELRAARRHGQPRGRVRGGHRHATRVWRCEPGRDRDRCLRKELVDHLRDRRSLLSAAAVPAASGPLIFAAMFTVIASWSRQERPLDAADAGPEHAPQPGRVPGSARGRGHPATRPRTTRSRCATAGSISPWSWCRTTTPGDMAARRASAGAAGRRQLAQQGAQHAVRRATRLLPTYGQQIGCAAAAGARRQPGSWRRR